MNLQEKLDKITENIAEIDVLIKYEQERMNDLLDRRSKAVKEITSVINENNKNLFGGSK